MEVVAIEKNYHFLISLLTHDFYNLSAAGKS